MNPALAPILGAIINRGKEPSSYGGAAALVYSVPALFVNPFDMAAWAATLAGVAAILAPERKVAPAVVKGKRKG